MSNSSYLLSKSGFLSGVQCGKKFYFDRYRKDLKPDSSAQQESLFEKGNLIGNFAKTLFAGGIQVETQDRFDFAALAKRTQTLLNQKVNTIYEAAFYEQGIFAALDILHHQDGERWAIEVKSSSSVKEYHVTDASLQYWVMCKSGIKPDKFFLMHVNSEYVKQGAIIPDEFFTLADITDQVVHNQEWVADQLALLKSVTENQNEPSTPIGKHCSYPFECDYKHHCWAHVPREDSVFDLTNARGREWDFYAKGIVHLREVPDDELNLTPRQQLQIDGVKYGKTIIDTLAIDEFVRSVKYPIYYFDFETINSPLPLLDNTSPYQQVPFQYSLHVAESQSGPVHHKEFLVNPHDFQENAQSDPRKNLIDQLKNHIGSEGSIMAYNASFEKNVIKSLAAAFPEDAEFLLSLLPRFVDLLDVFKAGWYYTPAMKGSASIKYVLPALFPDLSYNNLAIGNGEQASSVFLEMISGQFKGNEVETRTHLLMYCKQDTFAMVLLFNELLKINDSFTAQD